GRLGIRDEDADYKPLLLDWRAPAARPFYLATPVSPEGVRRRRHIKTVGREVTRLDDEVLDLAAAGQAGQTSGLNGRGGPLAPAPRWPTSARRFRLSRTGSAGPRTRARWWSRVAPAPGRRPWRCTAPPTCSTPTASNWPGGWSW